MARKKADTARDEAESGEDRSATLTEERDDDTSTTGDDPGSVSLAKTDEDDDVADGDRDDEVVAEDDADLDDDDDDLDDDDLDDDDDDVDDLDDDERDGVSRPAFFATLGVAVVAVLGVLFLLGGFVWPAFLGPGSPDDTAGGAVSALASKDQNQLTEVSCVRLDGSPAAQFPPELLALIGNVAPAGPSRQTLDTEARAPVDLTLTQGGQSQTLPADLLFGVTDGGWCLNGISQRQ